MRKSDKELAFLHDLYVETDWGERFAELVDEHVALPKEGRALYVGSGTGGHALALAERGGAALELVGVEESEGQVELARVKAASVEDAGVDFRHAQLEDLAFEDEQFDLVVGDASLVAPERLPEVLAEMVRVAARGATVSMSVASASRSRRRASARSSRNCRPSRTWRSWRGARRSKRSSRGRRSRSSTTPRGESSSTRRSCRTSCSAAGSTRCRTGRCARAFWMRSPASSTTTTGAASRSRSRRP